MSRLGELNTPVFKAEGIPAIRAEDYRLTIKQQSILIRELTLAEIKNLPHSRINARLTSVSGWSVRVVWEGVLWRDFIRLIQPQTSTPYVTFTSCGGYTTGVPLTDLDHPRVLLCYGVDEKPLEAEYGGPLRMVIPHRWGYKSCKWLKEIRFTQTLAAGFWESRGYPQDATITPGMTLDINTGQKRRIKGGEVQDF